MAAACLLAAWAAARCLLPLTTLLAVALLATLAVASLSLSRRPRRCADAGVAALPLSLRQRLLPPLPLLCRLQAPISQRLCSLLVWARLLAQSRRLEGAASASAAAPPRVTLLWPPPLQLRRLALLRALWRRSRLGTRRARGQRAHR